MNILCVDSGNTRIKWGLHDGARWTALGAAGHEEVDRLEREWGTLGAPDVVAAANVAGAHAQARIAAGASRWQCDVRWLQAAATACGVRNLYDAPEQLGVDRWAAVVAARALHSSACLVVIAGTATTLNIVAADGAFRGGAIIPGVALMKRALAVNTAKLPFAEGSYREEPRNTADAIESGCLEAEAGAIERMLRRLGPDAACVVSGGFAGALLPLLDVRAQYVEHLVLDGVRLLGSAAR
jgi:type III pantothenate kinase